MPGPQRAAGGGWDKEVFKSQPTHVEVLGVLEGVTINYLSQLKLAWYVSQCHPKCQVMEWPFGPLPLEEEMLLEASPQQQI